MLFSNPADTLCNGVKRRGLALVRLQVLHGADKDDDKYNTDGQQTNLNQKTAELTQVTLKLISYLIN